MKIRIMALAAAGLFIALFAIFVWPTRWLYFKEYSSGRRGASTTIVRVDRLTGKAYELTYQGWEQRKPAPRYVDLNTE